MVIHKRKTPSKTLYKHRAFSRYAFEQRNARKFLKILNVLIVIKQINKNKEECHTKLDVIINFCLLKLSKYYFVDIPNELGNVVGSRTIDSFSDCDCFRIFRFRKNHLVELFTLLNIPRRIVISNGSVLSGEEIFLFGINRLTCCNTIEDLVKVYGRDNSQWVRSFHWFIEFILVNWNHLLTNMLPFWKNSFQMYCNKIREKLITFNYMYDESFRIFGFIDCTVIKSFINH